MKVHYSSKRHDYGTPSHVFDPLAKEFKLTLDVCASARNAKLPHYFTPQQDALKQEWRGRCWMNPPYGRGPRGLPGFIRKAVEEVRKPYGSAVVALVPARTDTAWFRFAADNADQIRFVEGRIKFDGMDHGAPFPSAIIVFYNILVRGGPTVSWVKF